MSGIAGIIRFDGAPVAPGLVEKMTAAMAYRGPDGIRHWTKGAVALGQCMLRTTPESLEETQPLTNEDESLMLVMDGRVDNWEELRRELLGRGAMLRDRSDAFLARTGARPQALLLPLGPLAEHNIRATFAANLLASGGSEARCAAVSVGGGLVSVVRAARRRNGVPAVGALRRRPVRAGPPPR